VAESALSVEFLADQATTRLSRLLAANAPNLRRHVDEWMSHLSQGRPADYFVHPEAFPMLHLPLWLAASITTKLDQSFHLDLAYSSVCGYYFVRIVDDVMDGQPPTPAVIPAAIVLHTEFERSLARHFGAKDPFWAAFVGYSMEAAEAASTDASFSSIDRAAFLRVSSRKVAGAKIPLAATCHRYGRSDVLDGWSHFVDVFGLWHQMRNDLLGWVGDSKRGAATYFLSEAARGQRPTEPLAAWLGREGLAWAAAQLDDWMDESMSVAQSLGSGPLIEYLAARRESSSDGIARIRDELRSIQDVAARLDSASSVVVRRQAPTPPRR